MIHIKEFADPPAYIAIVAAGIEKPVVRKGLGFKSPGPYDPGVLERRG